VAVARIFNSALPFEVPVCLERARSSVLGCVLEIESLQWRVFWVLVGVLGLIEDCDSLNMAL